MISGYEFYTALCCVLATVATPESPRPDLDLVCFDFEPGNLSLVSTDGRRITVVSMRVAHAVAARTQFVITRDSATKLDNCFPADRKTRLTLAVFGPQLMITDGARVEVLSPAGRDFVGYRKALVSGIAPPTSARFYLPYLTEVMTELSAFTDLDDPVIEIHLQKDNICYFVPTLADAFAHISRVMVGIKPRGGVV